VLLAIAGAALLYGDGMITPSISVLFAYCIRAVMKQRRMAGQGAAIS
jgi:K+ transporter